MTTEIETVSGRLIDPLNPIVEQINIYDIAHALSNLCRFTGHVRQFYSVAQHSVLVAEKCTDQAWALLHDASEAYLCDVARPVKNQLPEYRAFEDQLMGVVCDRFGLTAVMPDEVRIADDRMLATEMTCLMPTQRCEFEPYGMSISPWSPEVALRHFLDMAADLGLV